MLDSPRIEPHRHRLHGLGCKVAGTLDEWCDAFTVIHECYVRAGLSVPQPHRMRVIPHHLLPTTSTLIARTRESVLGTLTLIRDSAAGLPIESVYADEVAALRDGGGTFAEVSCLATEPLSRTDYPYVCMRLMRFVGQHARSLGIERLLIATHPRHLPFYERAMGFQQFGRETSYPTAAGAPAVAAQLNFRDVDRRRPRLYDACFGSPIHREALLPHPMPRNVADYFRPHSVELAHQEFTGSCWEDMHVAGSMELISVLG